MKLSTKFDMQAVDFSKENILNLRIKMEAPELPDDFERPPAHIVTLLDKSGSMMGEKFSTLQSTMFRLIENLTEQDQLTIVWFNHIPDKTETFSMDKEGRKLANQNVLQAEASGGTQILEPLCLAKEIFGERASGPGIVEKILLMTDGETYDSEEGMIQQISSFRPEIGLSCFGYGLDYNENLLDELAKVRSGACHFIENTDTLGEAFGSELGSMLSRYSSMPKIEFYISADGEFVELLNDLQIESEEKDGKAWYSVQLGDILYGEDKDLFIRLKSEAQSEICTLKDIINISLKCEGPGGDSIFIKESADIELVKASDVGLPDSELSEKILLLDAAKTQLEAKGLADKGEWQNAKDIYEAMVKRLETYGTEQARGYADIMKTQSSGLNSSYRSGGSMSKMMSAGAHTVMGRRGHAGDLSASYGDMGLSCSENAFSASMAQSFSGKSSDTDNSKKEDTDK